MRAHLEHAPPSPAWEAAPPLRDRLQIGFGPFARTLSRVLSAAVSGRAPSQSPDSKTFLDLDASYFLDKRIYKADITLNVQPKVVTFMFGLSNTSGYGILALSCLVMHPDQWVLAQQITETTSVPKPYLLKILNLLAEAKLIEAKRGYRGDFDWRGRPRRSACGKSRRRSRGRTCLRAACWGSPTAATTGPVPPMISGEKSADGSKSNCM